MLPRIPRDELRRRRDLYRSSRRGWLLTAIAYLIVGAVVLALLTELRNSAHTPWWWYPLFFSACAGVLLPAAGLLLWSYRGRRRLAEFGLLCPGCEESFGDLFGAWAIASGRCPGCGGQVTEEWESLLSDKFDVGGIPVEPDYSRWRPDYEWPPEKAEESLSLGEFARRWRSFRRSTWRIFLLGVGLLFGGYAVLIALGIAGVIDVRGPWWVRSLYGAAFFALPLCELVFVLVYFESPRRMRRFGLVCPGCGAHMIGYCGAFVMTFLRCLKCGFQVIDNPAKIGGKEGERATSWW